METTSPAHWYDDSVALSAAIAELDWVTEDDLLGEDEPSCGPVLPDAVVLPDGVVLPDDGSAAGSPAGWSVGETLARVEASPPGPAPIHWLTSLDGRALSPAEALAVAGAWERQ